MWGSADSIPHTHLCLLLRSLILVYLLSIGHTTLVKIGTFSLYNAHASGCPNLLDKKVVGVQVHFTKDEVCKSTKRIRNDMMRVYVVNNKLTTWYHRDNVQRHAIILVRSTSKRLLKSRSKKLLMNMEDRSK